MTKHFKIPKGVKASEVKSDDKGDVWMDGKKIGNIHGKKKYKLESWWQNNEVIIAKLRKV
jgi:hypothetical protein